MNSIHSIIPTAYFGNIIWYRKVITNKVAIELYEYFEKQSLRNSCEIFSANGKLKLSVPIKERKNKTLTKDISIDNSQSWQIKHVRSIESAYRKSPFFEYYWDDYLKIFNIKFEKLIELNDSFMHLTFKFLKIKPELNYSTEYTEGAEFIDFKSKHHFKSSTSNNIDEIKKYHQVFNDKYGFIPNLWIGDVLFNLGNEAISVLK